MSKVNLGWIKDKNGEKYAPKTLATEVITKTGKNLEETLIEKIDSPQESKIGQFLVVKEVDENDAPLKWETVDKPVQDLSDLVTDNELSNTLSSYVKKDQFATFSTPGIVKASNTHGVSMNGSFLQVYKASSKDIASKTHNYRPIVPSTLDIAVKAGLANSKITWSDNDKTNARAIIGAKSNIPIDWEQNKEWADDYIANKPFYSYYERSYTPIEIFNNRIEPPVGSDYITYNFSSPLSIEYGDSFDFYINDFLCYSSSKFESAPVRFVPYRGAAVTSEVVLTIENVSFHSYDPVNVRIVKTSYNAEIIKQLDEKFIPNNIPKIDSASVGQTIEIKEVDENGKPTKWQAVDKGEGSGANIETDSELLEDSTNPIQNQAVTKEFNTFAGSIEITSTDPVKEKTVLTFNPDAEEINLYTVEEIDNKFSGTVEITDGNPSKENTVITVNPNAEEVNIYTAEEIDNKFSGTVEITNGEPVKENTVLTVNPEAEKINIYTVEEVDSLINNIKQTLLEDVLNALPTWNGGAY